MPAFVDIAARFRSARSLADQAAGASMGGEIGLRSELGRGTTFDLYLPAHGAQVAADSARAAIPRGNGQRIGVVDDEPQVRGILRRGTALRRASRPTGVIACRG